ncbi:PTS galactosamine/N-acetylgalactosamine transporter subunit IIA [Sporohalobacter salinus]|uniref:PTS galactosamine/N-acetylgalactosamine transporter subunit IIA n=1 Tax=Sporohalobacter salinus TaxID=1494606 RepID=UPI00196123C2|nr:PTS galactosamine/N-acetylgalactosamine transporter subunit IIA [Sporohalobacter salinus]MBM7624584.1 PTS system N-acetylgalactosamine-specific IIA component [Sporohalobacter salinus]
MIGIIITGHGNFATGLKSSLELIIGEQARLEAVDFLADESTTKLRTKLNAAVSKLGTEEGLVFFSDLVGGSPFKTSVLVAKDIEDSEVLAGTNLPMIMDILFARDKLSPAELKSKALSAAESGIDAFNFNNQSKKEKQGSANKL